MYQDYEIGTVSDEIQKFFGTKESKITFEINQISHLLSNELNINEKYIMSNSYAVPYNIKSNNIHASFRENVSSESIEEFLLRESWSTFDIMYSNHYNVPPDRKNLNHPMPDYVVYIDKWGKGATPWIIKALDDSQDRKFEKIYQSDQTNTVVFKINNT